MVRKMFWPEREEVTGYWRKLQLEELHIVYPSPNFIGTIKSRKVRWVVHVARVGEKKDAYRVLVGKVKERFHLKT
jgi:hypothetical protein